MSSLADDLADQGYAVVEDFLPAAACLALAEEIRALWEEGVMRQAAIGRGEGRQLKEGIRNDFVHWLEPSALSDAQRVYWERMEWLRQELNRQLYLGLFDLEAHLACYASGGYYKPHLDRHQTSSARILSTVFYLNTDWHEADGGLLRLYTDPEKEVKGPHLDITPSIGRVVIFQSAAFWHEVLPAQRERLSITGWFRRRD